MPSQRPNSITNWFQTQVLRLLGVTSLQERLETLEAQQTQIQQDACQGDHDSLTTQSLLSTLQKITDSVTTLDQKINAARTAAFLAHISDIHPKTKTVVFVGGSILGDNIKYAYLSFCSRSEKDGVACSFLPANAAQYEQIKAAGLPCLPYDLAQYTAQEFDLLLKTKVLVLDNHFVPPNWRQQLPHSLLHGAKTVQLWHGIPLKEIGLETVANGNLADSGSTEIFASCGVFDVFVAPSAASHTDWARKFAFKKFAPLGYPRNDVFFRALSTFDVLNVDKQALAAVQTANQKNQPVLFYAPTFRDKGEGAWFPQAEIEALADACATQDYLLYVNLHPAEQDKIEAFKQRYPRINFVAPRTDIYPLVKYADILITDYSSIAFDFLLLDRPILFYRPDHAAYITTSRGLIEDSAHYLCGAVTSDIKELVQAAGRAINAEVDPYRKARDALRKELFDHIDGLAAHRLNEEIFSLLDSSL